MFTAIAVEERASPWTKRTDELREFTLALLTADCESRNVRLLDYVEA